MMNVDQSVDCRGRRENHLSAPIGSKRGEAMGKRWCGLVYKDSAGRAAKNGLGDEFLQDAVEQSCFVGFRHINCHAAPSINESSSLESPGESQNLLARHVPTKNQVVTARVADPDRSQRRLLDLSNIAIRTSSRASDFQQFVARLRDDGADSNIGRSQGSCDRASLRVQAIVDGLDRQIPGNKCIAVADSHLALEGESRFAGLEGLAGDLVCMVELQHVMGEDGRGEFVVAVKVQALHAQSRRFTDKTTTDRSHHARVGVFATAAFGDPEDLFQSVA